MAERVPAPRTLGEGVETAAATVEEASLALLEMTLAAVAAAGAVSTLQLRMLLVVDRDSPLNLSSLAARLDLSVPSASRLVDRLVEASLVTRDVAQHSRREVALSLTPQGRRVLQQVRRRRRRAIAQVLDQMSGRDRTSLVSGLGAFTRAADF